MAELQELIKAQQEQIDILKELLVNQKVLTETYKEHCQTLQKQVDEALDLVSRSQKIIEFYQNL